MRQSSSSKRSCNCCRKTFSSAMRQAPSRQSPLSQRSLKFSADSVMASSRGRSAWPAPGRADRRRPCLPPSIARRPRSVRQIRSQAAIGKNAGVLRRWAPVPEYRSGHRRPAPVAGAHAASDRSVGARPPPLLGITAAFEHVVLASLFGRPGESSSAPRRIADALSALCGRTPVQGADSGATESQIMPPDDPIKTPVQKNSYGCLIGIPHPLWFSPNRYGRRSRADERPRDSPRQARRRNCTMEKPR